MRRFAPLAVPILFAAGWIIAMALWPVPAAIDWKIIAFVVVLAASIMGMQAAALVSADLREWGLGAGILGALLAPFGVSITVLALFTYTTGDLAPGWAESWSVRPAIVLQAVALIGVTTGLLLQHEARSDDSHCRGRWMVLGSTWLGAAVTAGHLYAVAFDVV
jgi:hypothetical protein